MTASPPRRRCLSETRTYVWVPRLEETRLRGFGFRVSERLGYVGFSYITGAMGSVSRLVNRVAYP
jgi:hypothetical protein